MKRYYLLLAFVMLAKMMLAQTARTKALELRSEYYTDHSSTQTMTIYWPKDSTAITYEIYKKDQFATNWTLVGNKNSSDSFFTTFYNQGYPIEFYVKKKWQNDSASGYIYCGENVFNNPISPSSNVLLLVIDSNYSLPLQTEINRLIQDLAYEYWEVRTHVVQRTDSVQTVKRWIEDQWNADSANIKSVLLLGHVPVPYSGNFNPDAHPDHKGAWPADVYYVTFGLTWTDNTVNTTSASRTANHNVPGDNKFDQDYIWPELAKIPLGRIDLFDMPAFGDDTTLMKRYLDKNHAFRSGAIKAVNRALIDDNFGYFGGEAFAANGWRVFTPIFDSTVYERDYFAAMGDSSYLFSYACGGGTYTSASGVGNSSNFANDSLLNPFTMLFGSYFGDWDNTNNFLRAPLASKGWGLASAWAGRPMWAFHFAALNRPIGEAAMVTQNIWPDYDAGYSGTYVHTALMGDPSLRIFTIPPPQSISATDICSNQGTLRWVTDYDSVQFTIFNNSGKVDQFNRLASDSTFDLLKNVQTGTYRIEVRNLNWMRNASGFFPVVSHPLIIHLEKHPLYNAGIGVSGGFNCTGDTLFISNGSVGRIASSYWNINGQYLTDKNDTFLVATQTGPYSIDLITMDSSGCPDSANVFFRVFEKPKMDSLFYAANGPVCDGDSNVFEFYAAYTPANGRLLLYWGDSSGGFNHTGGSPYSTTHVIRDSGTYTAHYLLNDSSGVCWVYDSVNVRVYPRPNPGLNYPPQNIEVYKTYPYQTTYSVGYQYYWNGNIGFGPGDSSHKVIVSESLPGIYYLSLFVENSFGCRSDSFYILFNVIATGLEDENAIQATVYPNPNSGFFYLRFSEPAEVKDLRILNTLGQEMTFDFEQLSATDFQIDSRTLSPGTYILFGKTGDKTIRLRFQIR